MSNSSEDILININNVKKNKCEGSLFLMTKRLAWMPAGKNNFTVSYNYSDIKLQKISPDTKEKVQLQVVLEAGGASTFHFNNGNGREAQMKDREAVKSLLQEMINKCKRNISSELEMKSQLLEENPRMFELYKNLVVSGKLTSEEFWSSRMSQAGLHKMNMQETGVSSGFLGDIQGHSDGCNGIKYNLTTDVINSIFKTYPAVQQKHKQLVPDFISDQQFWYEFFQSHYFHRDRVNISDKEVFAECAKIDMKALEQELTRKQKNSDFSHLYGNILRGTTLNFEDDEEEEDKTPSVNACLIRRFNQHSSMVLKAALNKDHKYNGSDDEKKKEEEEEDEDFVEKRARLEGAGETGEFSKETSLHLNKTEAYKHGPIPMDTLVYSTSDELIHASNAFKQCIQEWIPTPLHLITSSSSTLTTLQQLSAPLTNNPVLSHTALPSDLQDTFKLMQLTLYELLKHYWASFPAVDKAAENKVIRMEKCLRVFEEEELKNFEDQLTTNHLPVQDTTGSIREMLQKAHHKFSMWKKRKISKK